LKEVYSSENIANNNTKIMPCFFHFSQCLWRKANKLGLRSKEYLEITKLMILNLKSLAFNKTDEVADRFEKIYEEFQDSGKMFIDFLTYFRNNWIIGKNKSGKARFAIKFWNYSAGVNLFIKPYLINFLILRLKILSEKKK